MRGGQGSSAIINLDTRARGTVRRRANPAALSCSGIRLAHQDGQFRLGPDALQRFAEGVVEGPVSAPRLEPEGQAPDFKSAEPCRQRRAGYVCSDARAWASQRTVSALVLRRRLTCQALEPSYNRVIARCRLPDGRDLSCAALAAGAATNWDRYWRRYDMDNCS